jgi:hypothetical protein
MDMTTKRTRKAKQAAMPDFKPNRAFPMTLKPGDTHDQHAQSVAEQILAPETAAVRTITAAEGNATFGEMIDIGGALEHMRGVQSAVTGGDLAAAEGMLISQAVGLQSLYVRLIERATMQQWLPSFETYMRLGLKAQAQSRLAIEALAALKHGPAILARNMQLNVAHGLQQVNNTPAAPSLPAPLAAIPHADAAAFEIPPSKLISAHGEDVDTGTTQGAGGGNPPVAPLGEIHRAEDDRGKKARRAKPR